MRYRPLPVAAGPSDDVSSRDDRAPSRPFRSVQLPKLLLGALFTALVGYVVVMFWAYGRSWDEPLHDYYGENIYQWYRTGGADTTFMLWDPSLHLPQHGPLSYTVIALFQHWLEPVFGIDSHWYVRAIVCGMMGVVGIVGIALCGYELGGWWTALVAAAGLVTYPRYLGAIFNNPTDVPFAAAMLFVLWATIRLVRRWDDDSRQLRDPLLVGLLIGIAASIRVTALFWLGVLGLAAVWWWARHGRRIREDGTGRAALGRQLYAAALIAGTAYLTMLVCWPYIFLHPVTGLYDAYQVMAKYDWQGIITFEGAQVAGMSLPRRYAPEWLVIGSPVATVLLGLVGLAVIGTDVVRRRPHPPALLAAALLVVPVVMFVVLRPTFYNSLRHFLFVVPGLVLVGTYGLVRVWTGLMRRRRRVLAGVLAAVVAALTGGVVVETVRLHPYEYMYFSPVVGGYTAMNGKFETDYWATCQTAAIRWLARHHDEYPPADRLPVVGRTFADWTELPGGFPHVHAGIFGTDAPDFFISSAYFPQPAGYRAIHTVRVEGTDLCTVSVPR